MPESPDAGCPDDDLIARFLGDAASRDEAARVQGHIAGCARCRRFVSELVKEELPAARVSLLDVGGAPLSRGMQISRYVILDLIGSGAMGMVYRGYDPDLDRKVALKLLRPGVAEADASLLKARLFREAQAMARLVHPNVVAIHDVGVAEGFVFLAMDLIEGRSLRAWLAEHPRKPREILDAYLQAGRGLSAAHRAGLVHRDFKPDNVLVDSGSRALVGDFGLAQLDGPVQASPVQTPPAPISRLTDAGVTLGSPAYMAPEQFQGGVVDARSDIYAFCVALWEGLWKEHPFRAGTLVELRQEATAGHVRVDRPLAGVPARVRRALVRGLSPRPQDRFATMDELLDALSPDGRRRIAAVAALVALVAVVGVAVGRELSARAPLCKGGAPRMAMLWNDAGRKAVADGFTASKSPIAAETWERVRPLLDDYSSRWAALHDDVCAETRVRGSQSESMLDLRMNCLDVRYGELRALINVFRAADRSTVENAVRAASGLRTLGPCSDRAALLSAMPPPDDPVAAKLVESARENLARSHAQWQAGHYGEALPLAEEAVKTAKEARYPPAEAEALFELAMTQLSLGKPSLSQPTMREAAAAAVEGRNDALAARAETKLVRWLADFGERRTEETLQLAAFARAEVARAGDDVELRADLLGARGAVFLSSGQHDKALAEDLAALDLREKASGADPTALAGSLMDVYIAYFVDERHAEGLPYAQRAHQLTERALGPDHPDALAGGTMLGLALSNVGRNQEARAALAHSLEGQIKTLGADHLALAVTHAALAGVALSEGRFEEAARGFDRQLSLYEKNLGPSLPIIGVAELGRAVALARLGRFAEARAAIAHGRKIATADQAAHPSRMPGYFAATEGLVEDESGKPQLARDRYADAISALEKSGETRGGFIMLSLDGFGRCLTLLGRAREALAVHQRALALSDRAAGQKSPLTCSARLGIASASLRLGDVANARAQAEQVIAICAPQGFEPWVVAQARFVLAQATWPSDRARALELAKQALPDIVPRTPRMRLLHEQVQRWLASRHLAN